MVQEENDVSYKVASRCCGHRSTRFITHITFYHGQVINND
ncbi:unnamed protein product [Tenebrio molitor]|nr:unnamed protein product [Tenebrio molitor]